MTQPKGNESSPGKGHPQFLASEGKPSVDMSQPRKLVDEIHSHRSELVSDDSPSSKKGYGIFMVSDAEVPRMPQRSHENHSHLVQS